MLFRRWLCVLFVFFLFFFFFFFFFKQKTAYEIVSRDWSSDVCSSDLEFNTDIKSLINSLQSQTENLTDSCLTEDWRVESSDVVIQALQVCILYFTFEENMFLTLTTK